MAVNYRDLIVGQKARELVKGVDRLIDAFPRKTQANVIAEQLFDAVTSIGANIAEGKAEYVGKEYLRYLSHSQGSANETDHWLNTIIDCDLSPVDQVRPLLSLNTEVLKMLSAARASLAQQLESGSTRTLKEPVAVYETEVTDWYDPLEAA